MGLNTQECVYIHLKLLWVYVLAWERQKWPFIPSLLSFHMYI